LTFAILKTCCAPDFPPEVAYLVKWNLVDFAPFSPVMYQLQSVKSAFHFMFSALECSAGDDAAWSGVWGLHGLPFNFMAPLTRRPECSYATHVDSCLRKYTAAKTDSEENRSYRNQLQQQQAPAAGADQLSGIAKRPYEEFAMFCRWNRVEARFDKRDDHGGGGDGGGLAPALKVIVEDSLNRLMSVCHVYAQEPESFFAAVRREDEAVLMAADVVIWCLKLVSNAIRVTDVPVVETLYETVIEPTWSKLLSVFSCCANNNLLFPRNDQFAVKSFGMKLKCVTACMWKMAAELARRSVKYAEAICTHSSEVLNTIIALTGLCSVQAKAHGSESCPDATLDAHEGSTDAYDQTGLLWALRFWRCCISYRICLGAALDLLLQLGAQVERLSAIYSEATHVEILEVLEEVAVACSAHFADRSAAPGAATAWGVTISDFLYIDISRVLIQIVAAMLVESIQTSADTSSAHAVSSSAVSSSRNNLIASVIGCGLPSVPVSGDDGQPPVGRGSSLTSLETSHIRGPGLSSSLAQFDAFISQSVTTGEGEEGLGDESSLGGGSLGAIVGEKPQGSLSGLMTTICQLKTLFVEWVSKQYLSSAVFRSYELLHGDVAESGGEGVADSGLETKMLLRLKFERILSSNRLALCYFSILMSGADSRALPSCTSALHCTVARGKDWIQSNEWHNEDSVANGLYSVKVRHLFVLIQMTHVQLFCLSFSRSQLPSSGSPLTATQPALRGDLQDVMQYLPSLCTIVPFTACRCLHAVLTCVTAEALSSAGAAAPPDGGARLVVKIMNAAYGMSKKHNSDQPEEDGGEGAPEVDSKMGSMSSILQSLSSLEHEVGSGFLYCYNHSQITSFAASTSLVNEYVCDNVLFSSVSMLCHIDQHWKFCALASLKGVDLYLWLRVLHHMTATPSQEPAAQVAESPKREVFCAYAHIENISQQLYWLARLPVSDIVTFFGLGESAEEKLGADPLSLLVGHYCGLLERCYAILFEEKVCWTQQRLALTGPGAGGAAVQHLDVYMEVGEFFEVIASTQNRSLFMADKVSSKEASAEVSVETVNINRKHIQNKIRNRFKNGATKKKNAQSKCTGVEDLCERLMDGLANQQYHSHIHAASVSCVLIPGIIGN
jgi:hypothetical protein